MSETWCGNSFDETEETGWRNVDKEENNFISNSYSLMEQAKKKKSGNSSQSISTIQSSSSEVESSLDMELFTELFKIWSNLFLAIIWLSIIQIYVDLQFCWGNAILICFLFHRPRGKWKLIIFFQPEFSALKPTRKF